VRMPLRIADGRLRLGGTVYALNPIESWFFCIKQQLSSDVHVLSYRTSTASLQLSAAIITVFSQLVRQNGPGERRHVGDRTARPIGLIFARRP
jgi:hypothetical protein